MDKRTYAAWCPECRAEMAKCDEECCCLGCGASLIPIWGTDKQRKQTEDAIEVELDNSSIHGNAAIQRQREKREADHG